MTNQDMPSMIVYPCALTSGGRVIESTLFNDRETVGEYMRRLGLHAPRGAIAAFHNGRRVPDALWQNLIPRRGDQVVIRQRATGGGNGDSNKLLRAAATIAVVLISIYAPYAAPASWGALSATGGVTVTGALISAGIMIGGSLLVTPLLPEVKL